ncbi:hypothetical protein EHQ58_18090 [Leptospira ognonensis]|uniref:Uncharacterized protein n=1 Tax=Leptospira ognonensis TaxID=2484945 RepID=A0A4R9JY40_9LEPT|nr:hypothetical protein [Leptospira ognonensis]TGL56528.1 hypothetical protein EHQ58_18090 [Leptospira ognonensis]
MISEIKENIDYLMKCLAEVLEEADENHLIPYLLFQDRQVLPEPNKVPPPKTAKLLSLCFHLLNMVEENGAAQYRRSIRNMS